MNFIETIAETIQKHNINSLKKQYLLLAYLSLHLENPGLHPDNYMSGDGGYQGWMVLLMDKVYRENILGVPDNFTYPCWLFKLQIQLTELDESYDSGQSTQDELDLVAKIHTVQNWLEDMKPSELDGTVQLMQTLYLTLADENDSHDEEAEKPAGTLKEAADVLNWILTK